MKTNSKSLLCLQFVAQAFGVKGVEMCPHSSLTALEPAPKELADGLICSSRGF